ncbi:MULTISPECIES: restriction endonuclease subunit S [Acinetobacter]|uniref:Restriction endonuclease subunit S n=1 Tax=Acinetobacter junii TaxID=40215 RepID=A0A365PIJ6_ACIJU|nr:restriction endonuclease subunit S [Acinetobacter junii]RBA38390.1 restriction endonuclease subunit S [Acinetobacter junii]RBA46440.1 restriction endonuclease subunit S [Acinetobacter junii]
MTDVKQLITEHLDIWRTAETEKKSGRGASSGSNDTIYGVQKLRELILDLAISGKLVAQNPNDEPALELFKRIKAEQKDLIKNKIIRKPKALPLLDPSNTKQGWITCYLLDIGDWGAGATPPRGNSELYGGDIPWFKSGELSSDYINSSEEYVTQLALEKCSLRLNKPNDVLIAMYGATIGKTSITTVECTTNQAVCACTLFGGLPSKYLLIFLKAKKQYFIGMGAGGAQPNISREKLIETIIEIPPLEEQHRIVEKVDELMQLCDQLEQKQTLSSDAHATLVDTLLKALTESNDADEFQANWQRIVANFDLLFSTDYSIEQLKQTVLQLAVMGKLVKQVPSDEPASELLKKIADEKAKLIKEGKIKKSKPLPEITEEEKPFELPSGWEFFRLQELGNFCGGKTPSKANPAYWDGTIPWVSPKDMKLEEIYDSEDHVTALAIQDGLELLPPNSLLFVVRSGILRRTFPLAITKEEVTINQDIKALKLYDFSVIEYLVILFKGFEKHILINLTKTGTTVESLKVDDFINYPFIIPPLNEQKRIVEKVNQLFSMIEQLQVLQSKLQKTKIYLADALVANAVEGV